MMMCMYTPTCIVSPYYIPENDYEKCFDDEIDKKVDNN